MKKIAVMMIATLTLVLAGCTSASEDTENTDLVVIHPATNKDITCVLWSPYAGQGAGNQMECFK